MPVFDRTYTTSSTVAQIEAQQSPSIAAQITSAVQTATPIITSTLEQGGTAAIVGGDPASFATALAQQSISAFAQNTANASASNVKTATRDPIKSSLAARSRPSAGSFITDPVRGTTENLNIGRTSDSSELLSTQRVAQIAALAARFGTDVPVNDAQLASLMESAGALIAESSLMESFGSFENSELFSGVQDVLDSTTLDEDISAFASYASRQIGSAAGAIGDLGSMLASGFTEGLPSLADEFGNAIPGLPTDLDPDILNMIKTVGQSALGIATAAMCGNASSYSNYQNLFNSLAGMSADQGILCALMGFLASGRANASTYNVLRQHTWGVSNKGMANIVFAISEAVGPGTIQNGLGVAGNLIRKGYADPYDIQAISDTMDSLSVAAQDLFTDKDTTVGGDPVWSNPDLVAADPEVADTLLGEEIVKMTNRSNEIEVESLPWQDTVNNQGVFPSSTTISI